MRFRVWVTTKAPLAVSRHRATGNQLETAYHIPGTSWRGALAASMIAARELKTNAHLDPTFQALFLAGRVRFGDLRYGGAVPFPLSGRICARHAEHRMRDLLLCRQLAEDLPRTCEAPMASGRCGSKTQLMEGCFRVERDLPRKHEPETRILAHTAISNESLRVREGQFHSSTVVERRSRFRGEVWCRGESAASAFQQICRETPEIAIGRATTRGQGLARLEVEPLIEQDAKELTLSLRKLNAPFQFQGKLAFTVTLNSPCLVYDPWNFARPYLQSDDLAEASGSEAHAFSRYRLTDWFSRMTTIEGWNAQSGMPKSTVYAIAPGSAFLFVAEVATEEYDREIARLASLLASCATGIGERWEEGFGEARFCDAMHARGDDYERV